MLVLVGFGLLGLVLDDAFGDGGRQVVELDAF